MERPRRFGGRLAALSSAAILAVYAVGYTVTEEAAQSAESEGGPLQAAAPATGSPAATSVASGASGTPRASSAGSAATATSTATQRATVTATATSAPAAYRDGTYVGYATGRHGSIEATVTVSGGRIAAVEISQCLTRYPCSRINSLPGQVVSRQTAQVDYVSGATDSSRTFMQAVKNALSSAA